MTLRKDILDAIGAQDAVFDDLRAGILTCRSDLPVPPIAISGHCHEP